MKWKWLIALCVLAGLSLGSSGAQAGEPEEENWLDKVRNPLPKTSIGADLRIRQEYYENAIDFLDESDDTRNQFRVRGRVWVKSGPWFSDEAVEKPNGLTAFVRFTAEPRYNIDRASDFPYQDDRWWANEEIVVDNLWLEVARPSGLPFTVKAGRMDLNYNRGAPMYGRGWVLFDGTPLDGSRTVYNDGVTATIHLDDWQADLDLIYLDTRAEDLRLRPIADKDFFVRTNDAVVTGAYLIKNLEDQGDFNRTQGHLYYIYKDEDIVLPSKDMPGNSTNMVGALLQGKMKQEWDYYLEGGYQWGSVHGGAEYVDRKAWGLQTEVGYTFAEVEYKPRVHVGYEYLSGDDPDSSKSEQWDPFLGEWPQWGDLFAYRWAFEARRPGCLHNLQRFNAGVAGTVWDNPDATLVKKVKVSLDYHLLLANENTSAGMDFNGDGMADFSDGGKTRGHLLVATANCSMNEWLSSHVDVEYFSPNNYYGEEADEAVYMRWEFKFKF